MSSVAMIISCFHCLYCYVCKLYCQMAPCPSYRSASPCNSSYSISFYLPYTIVMCAMMLTPDTQQTFSNYQLFTILLTEIMKLVALNHLSRDFFLYEGHTVAGDFLHNYCIHGCGGNVENGTVLIPGSVHLS